ncbi:hypothetical protein CO653_24930 [Rhizobium anhuiense]|uniref:hypothetical protein n=1 Tax=Rhizobium anhuiense TaxID=1184720 RepID=UPI000BE86973|nr:hypothetical protein [Rhizobium anhuiense]PDS63109.1 hypothetical protein CO653_24930 [Rhizobium anhuiense]
MTIAESEKIDVPKPSKDLVREQLDRILKSPTLDLPRRARRFLEFIVDETLAGREDCLKGRTIAQVIFARGLLFDPNSDPCVRIEAGRIRRELERYYLLGGAKDAIRIAVPKGTYVPTFQFVRDDVTSIQNRIALHSPPPSCIIPDRAIAPSRSKPQSVQRLRWTTVVLIAVLAFTALATIMFAQSATAQRGLRSTRGIEASVIIVSGFAISSEQPATDVISQGLTDEIVRHLVPHNDLIVKVGTSMPSTDGSATAASYTLEGSVMIEQQQKIRFAARLIRQADGVILWAENYDSNLSERSPLDIQLELGAAIAMAVAQRLGVAVEPATRSETPEEV